MWRFHTRVRPPPGAFACLGCSPNATSFARRFSQHSQHGYGYARQLPPVRLLGPTLWSVAAVSAICISCATYEVRRDVKQYTATRSTDKRYPFKITERDLEMVRKTTALRERHNQTGECGRVFASIVGINLATLAPSMLSPALQGYLLSKLAHFPAEPNFRYHTLLTSALMHDGPLHLGMNMLVFYNFGPELAHTPALQSSGSAFLAFCLSAAVTSSLGHHLSTAFWPNKHARFGFGLGFSGVVSALLAASCVVSPHSKLSIFPIPVQFEAQNFLQGLKLFEVLGVLGLVGRVIPAMSNIGFAAHLGGLLFGETYGKLSGHGEIWLWFRSQVFQRMKELDII